MDYFQHQDSDDDWQPLNSKMHNNNEHMIKRLKTQQNQYESRKSRGSCRQKMFLKINNNILLPKKIAKPYDFNPFDNFTQQNGKPAKSQEKILENHFHQILTSKQNVEKVLFVLSENNRNFANLSEYRAILAKSDQNRFIKQNYLNQGKIKVTQLFKISGQRQSKNQLNQKQKPMGSTFYRNQNKFYNLSNKRSQIDNGNISITVGTCELKKKMSNKQKNLQKILKIRQHLRKRNNYQSRMIKNQITRHQIENKKQKNLVNRKANWMKDKCQKNEYTNLQANQCINFDYNKKKVLKQADRSIKKFVKVDQNKNLYLKPQSFKNKIVREQVKSSLRITKHQMTNNS